MKYRHRCVLTFLVVCCVMSLIILYSAGVIPQYKDDSFRSNGLPQGLLALHHWIRFIANNDKSSHIAATFLEANIRKKHYKKLDLKDISSLWQRFSEDQNISGEQADRNYLQFDRLTVEDVILWGAFINRFVAGSKHEKRGTEDLFVEKLKQAANDANIDDTSDDNSDEMEDLFVEKLKQAPNDANSDEMVHVFKVHDKVHGKVRDKVHDKGHAVIDEMEIPEPPMVRVSGDELRKLSDAAAEQLTNQTRSVSWGEKLNIHHGDESSLAGWKVLQNHIRRHRLYDPADPTLEQVLYNLRTLPIVGMDILPERGTQTKMVFRLSDGSRAMAKPKRMSVHIEVRPDTYYYDDTERFYAEVAAYHLDRLLGFYRVPPVVTRYVHITKDIKRNAPPDLMDTFYKSIAGNECFYGLCSQFCDTPFGVCGGPDLVPTSFAFYLPSRTKADRVSWENPWKQSYSRFHGTAWQVNPNYCEVMVARDVDVYNNTRRLLDIMDLAVFDFIQSNLDRHNFNTFQTFENNSNIFLYDNGRAFARSYRDEPDLLAPITQCCLIRATTLTRLLELYTDDVTLGDKLGRSLAGETVQPLLTDKHLRAVDRRLGKVLREIMRCIQKADNPAQVVKDDGY